LGLCAGLDSATEGEIYLLDHPLHRLGEEARTAVRNRHVGFVFQNFQLIPTLTALENVMIPLELNRKPNARRQAAEWLDKVGLSARQRHYPVQLSGGEQQRVALARAFANQPQILFADEPTGNLDTETGQAIEALLFELNQSHQTTLILVTHDPELAEKAQHVIALKGGQIVSQSHQEGFIAK
jgi:putative ABC transport system ATP-binding protein